MQRSKTLPFKKIVCFAKKGIKDFNYLTDNYIVGGIVPLPNQYISGNASRAGSA
jgi:hypothetical protein